MDAAQAKPAKPRTLKSAADVAARRLLLKEGHTAALSDYVEELRRNNPLWEYPDFDPLDGGVEADVLFLFEKPGPMTSAGGGGSGFISRDNDDPTAEATFAFMLEANLPRERTVTWNIIPGWNGTRKVTTYELREGVAALSRLLPLLSRLRTVVLVGRKAQRAKVMVENLNLHVLASPHPSPLVRAAHPETWREIPTIWAMAG